MVFNLISETKVNGIIPVTKYKSNETGLTVVLAAVDGPIVNGYFALATEAFDDDGLPHTLEHLIFLGSEQYPYKGVLDLLANRCLASGSNAWTDTDHTCYTMTTAGKDGFLQLLPIYLDHILYPTLSDAGFLTEVHHVTEEGEDGGVVYAEVQGTENTGEYRAHNLLMKTAYPSSGYSSDTGGRMHNLRTSTTNKKVKDYHAQYYKPENLSVIIAGHVEFNDVVNALQVIEQKILMKKNQSNDEQPFIRPWQTPVAPLTSSTNVKIFYPSDEEDCGIVNVAWRGPNCVNNNDKLTACSILLRYLTDTAVSPLQREFVEIDDPYASKVSFTICENLESLLYLTFENVPIEKIDLIFEKLIDLLTNIIDGKEKIDMTRMHHILDRTILECFSNLESNPHDTVGFLIIGDFLYGNTQEDFVNRLNTDKQLEYLKTVTESYWIDIIKEYMINGKHIVCRAAPSISEYENMTQTEKQRIERQREDLGPIGLRTKGVELADAMNFNERVAPFEMLTEVPVPSVDHINFHHVEIVRANEENEMKKLVSTMNSKLSIYTETYDLQTKFVYLIVTLNTDELNIKLRPYLLLYLELIMESPIRRGDFYLTYENVVAALESDAISSGTRLGLEANSTFSCGIFSQVASLMLQVEQSKYEKGVQWIIDLLHNTEFTIERIRCIVAKMINAVATAKRKGNSIALDLSKTLYFSKDSNVYVSSMLRQHKFLSALNKKMDDSASVASIINDLNELRSILTSSNNMAIHMAANWKEMTKMHKNLGAPWQKIVRDNDKVLQEYSFNICPDWKLMNAPETTAKIQGTVVGVGCVESAYLYSTSACLNNFIDSDFVPLLLFLQYLTQLEGPLWKQIRGQGFAYSYSMVPKPNEGLLYFTLYRAANVVAAFKEAKAVTNSQLSENSVWDQALLESARSSLIFELIEREKSIGDLVVQSFLSTFKKVPTDYNRTLVKQVNQVTIEDLVRVGKIYVSRLFSSDAKTAIVCHPDKAKEVAAAFEEFGQKLVLESSLDCSILAN